MAENSDDEILSENDVVSVGAQLKAQREKLSMSINDVADKTRITLRHLEAIEKSQFHKLPGKTYIIGFARAYARAVELNDAEIAAELRMELSEIEPITSSHFVDNSAPAAASSIAPKTLAWTAAIIGAIALAAFLIWRAAQVDISSTNNENETIGNETIENETVAPDDDVSQEAPTPDPIALGKVIMTANDEVWFEIYDADRKTINENVLQAGDSYEIPSDANGPMIVTGKPDALNFTVGGKAIKPLGDGSRTIKDVGVSAEALIAYQNSTDSEAPSSDN